jgi:arsenate reductase (thioredoxin)
VKKKVLFLCIGNSCRSQMAEGFARHYASDLLDVCSAGLSPASIVQPLTVYVMAEKSIKIDQQYPKDLTSLDLSNLDLLINMSGVTLPKRIPIPTFEWKVQDPIGCSDEVYRKVRDQIEGLVNCLILDLRRESAPPPAPPRRLALLRRKPR